MKIFKLIIITFFSILILNSCSDDDEDEIAGYFENGILILNEGSQGQGTVSFLSNDFQEFTKDAYTNANPRDLMGTYAQSMFFDGDNIYIISGGSQKINVVNRKTFKLVAKIETGLKNPRYGVVNDGKAYVTNANSYSFSNPTTANTDDYLVVINLLNNTIETKIPLNATADKLVFDNDKIFIIEPYNSSKILILNTKTNTLEPSINIGAGANSLEISNGFLYVLKSTNLGNSQLVKVNLMNNEFTSIDFPDLLNGAKNLDIYKNNIYFTANNKVYGMNIASTFPSETSILEYTSTSSFGIMYGFAVNNDKIFTADGGDFTKDSFANIYSLNGTLQKTINVGVGPNGFYFN